jgi:hypothetical protein
MFFGAPQMLSREAICSTVRPSREEAAMSQRARRCRGGASNQRNAAELASFHGIGSLTCFYEEPAIPAFTIIFLASV